MKGQPALDPTTTYAYLDRAQQLIAAPGGYVQGREAITIDGTPIVPHSDLAVAYCVEGALKAVTYYHSDDPAIQDEAYRYCYSILNMANPTVINFEGAPGVNDSTNQQRVVLLFERAKQWLVKYTKATA